MNVDETAQEQTAQTEETGSGIGSLSVGIIGGGATGLTAAYRLLKAGVGTVCVYERSPRVGGLAGTFRLNGAELEFGYHHWYVSDTDILGLMEELDIADSVEWVETSMGMLCEGSLYPFTAPFDLLKFTPLNMFSRLRLGFAMLYAQNRPVFMFEDVTAAEWLRQWAGESAYDKVWGPMLRGKFGEYHDKVTMAWIWSKLNTRVKSRASDNLMERLGYPTGGFGRVFDELAQAVATLGGEIYVQVQVDEINVDDEDFPILRVRGVDSPKEDAVVVDAHDVILATMPSPVFKRVVGDGLLTKGYLSKLDGTPYMTADLLILETTNKLSDFYWINVADRNMPFLGVIEHTNLVGPEYYSGKNIVYLTNYFTHDSPRLQATDEELLEACVPLLKQINPEFDPSWIMGHHRFTVPGAQPIMTVNYPDHMPGHRTSVGGVYLANTSQIYPEDRGTNYSVRLGNQVADMILEDLSAPEVDWPSED